MISKKWKNCSLNINPMKIDNARSAHTMQIDGLLNELRNHDKMGAGFMEVKECL